MASHGQYNRKALNCNDFDTGRYVLQQSFFRREGTAICADEPTRFLITVEEPALLYIFNRYHALLKKPEEQNKSSAGLRGSILCEIAVVLTKCTGRTEMIDDQFVD